MMVGLKGSHGDGGGKGCNSGSMFRVEALEFADGLDMGCEKKKRAKLIPRFLALAAGTWGRLQNEQLWGEDREFGLDIRSLRCV